MVHLGTLEDDMTSDVSTLEIKKLEMFMDTKIKEFGDNMCETIKQSFEARFKQSAEELSVYLSVMKNEHRKLVIDMSHVHDKLSNLQHLPSEVRVFRRETDNHIQRLRSITDAVQTSSSSRDGKVTNLNRIVEQMKLELDVLRLDHKMKDMPANVTSDFKVEVFSQFQCIHNDLHSQCNRQEANVQALQSTFDVVHRDVQSLDSRLLDTQKAFSHRIDELTRVVTQLDNTRKRSGQEAREDWERDLRALYTDVGRSVFQQRDDDPPNGKGVADCSSSESLQTNIAGVGNVVGHTTPWEDPCKDTSLKVEKMRGDPTLSSGNSKKTNVEQCIDNLRCAFATQVQSFQQAINTQIDNVTKDRFCSKGPRNSHVRFQSHRSETDDLTAPESSHSQHLPLNGVHVNIGLNPVVSKPGVRSGKICEGWCVPSQPTLSLPVAQSQSGFGTGEMQVRPSQRSTSAQLSPHRRATSLLTHPCPVVNFKK